MFDPARNGNEDSRAEDLIGQIVPFTFLYDNTPFPVVAVALTLAFIIAGVVVALTVWRWVPHSSLSGRLGCSHAPKFSGT